MKRDHSCQFPFCIRTENTKACKKCGTWLCPDHLEAHDCKRASGWNSSSPSLNAVSGLGADDVRVKGDKVVLRVKLYPRKNRPRRRDWERIIDR